jgi:hypothetical protein
MSISKMTYEETAAVPRTGKTVSVRKLFKRGLKQTRNTHGKTYLLSIKALIAHRMEHDYRSVMRFASTCALESPYL